MSGIRCVSMYAVLGLASWAAHAGGVSSSAVATFTEAKAYYLGSGSSRDYPIVSAGDTLTIGGVVGGVGASASGTVSAKLEGHAEAFWFPQYSFAFSSSNVANVTWNGNLYVGDSFFVSTAATPLSWGKVQLTDPGFKGSIGLREQLYASASAKGCLGGCAELSLWMKLVQYQSLLSILGGKGSASLLVLGQKVADILPYTYTTPDNSLKLSVGAPDFSKTIPGTGSAAPVSTTSEQLLAKVGVDVAQLIANLVGLPVPLSGSKGGFGYTLLEAVLGLGLDLERSFQLAASKLYTSLSFSAPVQVLENGVWSAPKNSFTPAPGSVHEVRPVQASKTLGITPWYGLNTDVDAKLDLVPFASASLRALEVYGHGLSFGPVVNENTKQPLAHVELDSTDVTRSYWITGKPMTLEFDPIVLDINDQPIANLCAIPDDCLNTGFIPVTSTLEDGWLSDEIFLAKNLVGACLNGVLDDPDSPCDIDPGFTPLRVDYRSQPDPADPDGSSLPFEFTPRYQDLRAILDAPEELPGPESSVAMLDEGLRDLIGSELYDNGLPRRAPAGDPAPTEPIAGDTQYEVRIDAVPEPGAAMLLAIGFVALAVGRFRIRRAITPPSCPCA